MASGSSAGIGKRRRFGYLAAAASLAALAMAEPAWAQCATATAGGITTLTCGDTATTNSTNNDPNNPSTDAARQVFANAIDAGIAQGVSITGFGLRIAATGNNPITVTNNGSIRNTAALNNAAVPRDGLVITGNRGLITYRGNGSAGTNSTEAGGYFGVLIDNRNGGGSIVIGSQAAPVTGTFNGGGGSAFRADSGGTLNAWFHGGSFATDDLTFGLYLTALGNIDVVMTGGSSVAGSLVVDTFQSPASASASLTTDAHVTSSFQYGILVNGQQGGTSLNLTTGASLSGRTHGAVVSADAGVLRFTSAAGTNVATSDPDGNGAYGVSLESGGSIVADVAGAIDASGTGLRTYIFGDGATDIIIREGATIRGSLVGLETRPAIGTGNGTIDILNLGTISSPGTAVAFAGTLRVGNGGTAGTIDGNVINLGALIFNRSDAVTYGGIVSGTGTLAKQGAGTLTLTGASSYTGATTVSAGTLNVNGALTSAVTVANGATLGGTGSVGATTVNGILSPGGGGIGTLTINGNLVFGAGSTFRVDLGNGTADRVNVTGTAALAGGVAAFASGSVFTAGTYTLLNAGGGITGTFSPLTTSPSAIASLRYDANNVYLDVNLAPSETFANSFRESLVFSTPTVTVNRVNVFSTQIIGRLLGGQPLYDQTFAAAFNSAAVQNGVTAARAAITTAGGPGVIIGDPVRTSSSTTSTTTSSSIFSVAGTAMGSPNTVITFGPAVIQIGTLSACNVTSLPSVTKPTCTELGGTPYSVGDDETNYNTINTTIYTIAENRTDTINDTLRETWELNGQVVAVGTIHAEVQSGLFDLGGRLLGRLGAVQAGSAGWGEVYRFRVSQSGRRDAWGLAGGAALAVAPGVTLAAGIDHGRLDIDVAGALETGEVELTQIGAALRFESGRFAASVAAVHGFGNAETRRTIIGRSDADYDVRLTGVGLEISYAIAMGGWTLRPGAGLDYVSLSTDGFTESDTLGLVVGHGSEDRVRASAGLSIERDFGGFALLASARYLAVLSGGERSVPVAFAVAPGRALDMSAPGEPDGALLGARLSVPLSAGAAFFLGYDGRFGGDYEAHAGTAGVRVAF